MHLGSCSNALPVWTKTLVRQQRVAVGTDRGHPRPVSTSLKQKTTITPPRRAPRKRGNPEQEEFRKLKANNLALELQLRSALKK